MHRGFIKLHRIFKDWEWYTEPNMVLFLIHCLLRANHKDGTWKGQSVLKGQFVSGRKTLSTETGLSEQKIRTCIDKLILSNELTIKSTSKNTLFMLLKWEKYQILNESEEQPTNQTTSQITNQQPTDNQPITTNKNVNNEKNEENIKYIVAEEFLRLWNEIDGITVKNFRLSSVKIKVFNKIMARHKIFKEEGFNLFFQNVVYSCHIFKEKWFTIDFCIKNDENFQKVIDMWMDWKKNPNNKGAQYSISEL
jgi:hypothetical protein